MMDYNCALLSFHILKVPEFQGGGGHGQPGPAGLLLCTDVGGGEAAAGGHSRLLQGVRHGADTRHLRRGAALPGTWAYFQQLSNLNLVV